MHRPAKTSGFTLLEVLIALLVFSLGLMGIAGLLVVSVQTNHSAYLRTQASFLAQAMADRMRANGLGVWSGSYVGTYTSASGGATGSACLNATGCSYAEVARRDLLVWSNQLASFMPNPTGTIACAAPAPLPSANQIVERPPYTSQCTITIAWGESTLQKGGTANPVTLAWVFQP